MTHTNEPKSFAVVRRNFGHWDIVRHSEGRLFRLRGGPGRWWVSDERPESVRVKEITPFKEQSAAMAWICAELMHELLIAEGQDFEVIEKWNV